MSCYIETFKINGTTYGIEDYEDGRPMEDHFFGHTYKSGGCNRFRLWRGGCGFGQATTLKKAREEVFHYAMSELTRKRNQAKTEMHAASRALNRLDGDVAHLFRFEVEDGD